MTPTPTPAMETSAHDHPTIGGRCGSDGSPVSETTETDAAAKWGDWQGYEIVPADFARKLERERDDAIAEATNAVNDIVRVRWERDEARQRLDRVFELSTHPDTYWAIEEIGRICDSEND